MRKPSLTATDTMVCAAVGVLLALAALTMAIPEPRAATGPICRAPAGAAATGYGTVHFANSCSAAVQPALQLAVAKLHSFEASEGAFTAIAGRDPGCAVAWWGAAMSARGNPLGGSLTPAALQNGRRYADAALKAAAKASPRERALIGATDTYFKSYPDQIARARAYADRMDAAHAAVPDDPDVAALDGLAIIEGVDLDDATHARQKRAGAILEAVMAAHPDHPGAPHYLIHAYDYAGLAEGAVHAAEMEPTLAPASSHAQHMPAHIWTMLGRWDASIAANVRSGIVAEPAAAGSPVKADIVYGHAFDFIAYARLQRGEDRRVGQDLAALRAKKGEDGGLPVIGVARYALERDDWRDAARIPLSYRDSFDDALARFTRAYGAARAGDAAAARTELAALRDLRESVTDVAGAYWGAYVDIYADAAEAWILQAEGQPAAALALAKKAADADDAHEKHIYLENKILPMRESLADLALAQGHAREALAAYEASLTRAPERWRSFVGAARAAQAAGDGAAAKVWAGKVLALGKDGDKARPGWAMAMGISGRDG